jgi:hypothetical protein
MDIAVDVLFLHVLKTHDRFVEQLITPSFSTGSSFQALTRPRR